MVGKGGVGKSTTAAALALAWADAGHATHLISTDPAHSLGDVLAHSLEPGRVTSPCVDTLSVEEFDAETRARRWLAELRAPLTSLFEQGSYLDGEDIARFTALRLPGIDEVMAALRLLELADAPATAIVVDTAPTGHTLRLLDAGVLLASWTEVLDALAAKAAAVSQALTGYTPAGAGAELRRQLHAQLEQFAERVLKDARFVVVTRAGGPVAAETTRLADALAARGLVVQATIHVGPGVAATPAVRVPWLAPAPRGCAGLRTWRAALRGTVSVPAPAEGSGTAAGVGSGAAWLAERPQQLLLFAGKGGVGKSTCAAAAALELARDRDVLLLGADPAGSLGDVLGLPVGAEPRPIAPRLRVVQLDAAAALAEWRTQLYDTGDALLARLGPGDAALDRHVLEAVWNLAPPGMDELVALAALLDLGAEGETIVLDSAPTGHLLRLLALPATAQDWTHAVMRTLLKYGVAGQLDALAARLLAFAKQLKDLRSRLADAGRTGVIAVTLDEPVVQAETDRLLAQLDRAGIPLAATLTNRSDSAVRSTTAAAAVRLHAPLSAQPLHGRAALREFVSRWELA